jgi:hypothetical protein
MLDAGQDVWANADLARAFCARCATQAAGKPKTTLPAGGEFGAISYGPRLVHRVASSGRLGLSKRRLKWPALGKFGMAKYGNPLRSMGQDVTTIAVESAPSPVSHCVPCGSLAQVRREAAGPFPTAGIGG